MSGTEWTCASLLELWSALWRYEPQTKWGEGPEMQHNLSTSYRRLHPGMLGLAIVASILVSGCGLPGGDDDEPTATVEVIAQPTAGDDLSEAATLTSVLSGQFEVQSTPVVSVATPDLPAAGRDDATPATPDQAPPAFTGTPVSPGESVALATPESGAEIDAGEVDTAIIGSDGTSGATPELESPDGSVDGAEASPTDDATPVGLAPGELLDIDPISVASCEPENIPPFGTEQNEFLTVTDVNFRIGPGADCDQIGDGPIGINIPVTVLSGPVVREDDDTFVWVQVQIVDEIGWIVVDAIEPAP